MLLVLCFMRLGKEEGTPVRSSPVYLPSRPFSLAFCYKDPHVVGLKSFRLFCLRLREIAAETASRAGALVPCFEEGVIVAAHRGDAGSCAPAYLDARD